MQIGIDRVGTAALQINGVDGKMVVRVHTSGKVELSEGCDVNETAKMFWDAVRAVGVKLAAGPAEDAQGALTPAELQELRRATDDLNEGHETDVEHDLLARGAIAGYLHCERFIVLDCAALDAAIAAQAAAQGGA